MISKQLQVYAATSKMAKKVFEIENARYASLAVYVYQLASLMEHFFTDETFSIDFHPSYPWLYTISFFLYSTREEMENRGFQPRVAEEATEVAEKLSLSAAQQPQPLAVAEKVGT